MEEEKKLDEDARDGVIATDSDIGKIGTADNDIKKATITGEAVGGAKRTAGSLSKKKTVKQDEDEDSVFSFLPEAFSAEELSPVELEDEERIENEAISSLPEAPSLDLLLYDNDDGLPGHETGEEAERYENFLAEYKDAIANALSAAKSEREARDAKAAAQAAGEDTAEAASDEDNSTGDDSEDEEAPLLTKEKPEPELIETITEPEVFLDPDEAVSQEIAELLSEVKASAEEEETLEETPEEEPTGGEQMEMDLGISSLPENSDEEPESESGKETAEKPQQEEKRSFVHSLFEFAELFVFTLVIVMILTTFFFRHSVVDGSSMEKTLHNGDHLIVSGFMYQPDYGDIIVFTKDNGDVLVKRVVALAGDVVDFRYDNGEYNLSVNGAPVDEKEYKYISPEGGKPYLENYNLEGYTVPEGQVFVLGDHRNNSTDSRNFLGVDTDHILGKVVLRFYPFEDFGPLD